MQCQCLLQTNQDLKPIILVFSIVLPCGEYFLAALENCPATDPIYYKNTFIDFTDRKLSI